MIPADPEGRTRPAPAAGEASVLELVLSLWADLPGLLSDRVRLLALELKRAGLALAVMVALVIGAAVLVATAWLALWAGIAAALIEAGLAWGWAFLIVLMLNLAGAAFALLRAKSLAHLLTLPATMRRLTVAPAMVSAALRPAPDGSPSDHESLDRERAAAAP